MSSPHKIYPENEMTFLPFPRSPSSAERDIARETNISPHMATKTIASKYIHKERGRLQHIPSGGAREGRMTSASSCSDVGTKQNVVVTISDPAPIEPPNKIKGHERELSFVDTHGHLIRLVLVKKGRVALDLFFCLKTLWRECNKKSIDSVYSL